MGRKEKRKSRSRTEEGGQREGAMEKGMKTGQVMEGGGLG